MSKGLGELEQLLLFALVDLGEGAHGLDVRELIESRTGKQISQGALHTGYERLQRRGFVDSYLGEPTAMRGGRRKRHYSITLSGARALHETQSRLQQMAEASLQELERLAGVRGER